MRRQGVVRFADVVPPALCDELLAAINTRLDAAVATLKPEQMEPSTGFGTILARKNRYDMYLHGNDDLIQRCLRQVLQGQERPPTPPPPTTTTTTTTTTMATTTAAGDGSGAAGAGAGAAGAGGAAGGVEEEGASSGGGVRSGSGGGGGCGGGGRGGKFGGRWTVGRFFQELFDDLAGASKFSELSCVVSDPGAPRQPLHPDTHWEPAAPLFSVFMALQDIDETMGACVCMVRVCAFGYLCVCVCVFDDETDLVGRDNSCSRCTASPQVCVGCCISLCGCASAYDGALAWCAHPRLERVMPFTLCANNTHLH
jgi:hypothetical protein